MNGSGVGAVCVGPCAGNCANPLLGHVLSQVKSNKHMENWSDPLVRLEVFAERMLRLRHEVSRWQGKCAILRHENNKLREKLRRISQNVA